MKGLEMTSQRSMRALICKQFLLIFTPLFKHHHRPLPRPQQSHTGSLEHMVLFGSLRDSHFSLSRKPPTLQWPVSARAPHPLLDCATRLPDVTFFFPSL